MEKSGRELAQDLRNVGQVLRGEKIWNPLTQQYVSIRTSPGDETLETTSVEGRLRYLKRLHELNLISDAVYQEAQADVINSL